jgi:predicted nucleic acid-binding protein
MCRNSYYVLSRSSLRQSFPLLTQEKTERLIEMLLLKGRLFRLVRKRFDLPTDPDDEPYLTLAIEAGAQFLVPRDRDLLT